MGEGDYDWEGAEEDYCREVEEGVWGAEDTPSVWAYVLTLCLVRLVTLSLTPPS
jgi:hypothetical protein